MAREDADDSQDPLITGEARVDEDNCEVRRKFTSQTFDLGMLFTHRIRARESWIASRIAR